MTGVYLKETFNQGCTVDDYFTNWLSAHLHLLKFSLSLALRAFVLFGFTTIAFQFQSVQMLTYVWD